MKMQCLTTKSKSDDMKTEKGYNIFYSLLYIR